MKKGIFFGVSFLILMIYSASWAQIGNLGWTDQKSKLKTEKKSSPLIIDFALGYSRIESKDYSFYGTIKDKDNNARMKFGVSFIVTEIPAGSSLTIDQRVGMRLGFDFNADNLDNFDWNQLEHRLSFPALAGANIGLNIASRQDFSLRPFGQVAGGFVVFADAQGKTKTKTALSFGGGVSFKAGSFPFEVGLEYEHATYYNVDKLYDVTLGRYEEFNRKLDAVNLLFGFRL